MKVYLFDVTSGVYQGEDFLEPSEICVSEGVTCQSPPEQLPGYTPVYDQSADAWSLLPTDMVKKRVARHD